MNADSTKHSPALWLCLYFYQLPLDQLHLQDRAAAIVEKQHVVFVNEAAAAAGIYSGMRLATAHALRPDLHITERDTERELQALRKLTEWGYQFTPTVRHYKDFSILLEIAGSLNLFKGLSCLLQTIREGLHGLGFRYSPGLAHTEEGAWMLSHYQADHPQVCQTGALPEFCPPPPAFWLESLKRLPLMYLDTDDKVKQQLFNLGLRNLADVLNLPGRELGQRFGKTLLGLLAAITGEQTKPGSDFKPAPDFSASVDFANGITRIDELEQPITELLTQLLRFLNQYQLYAAQLEWRFFYFRQAADKLVIHTSAANNNLPSLLGLSKLKLEHFALKAPVESLVLFSESFSQASATSGELFPELSHPSTQLRDYRKLLDKLLARLGGDRLSTLLVADEHLPECRQVVRKVGEQTIQSIRSPAPMPAEEDNGYLPLWLSRQPVPIAAPGESSSPLRVIWGPRRVDSHWWQQRQRRDYFIACHKNGSYCWVYKDLNNENWFLQGFYG